MKGKCFGEVNEFIIIIIIIFMFTPDLNQSQIFYSGSEIWILPVANGMAAKSNLIPWFNYSLHQP